MPLAALAPVAFFPVRSLVSASVSAKLIQTAPAVLVTFNPDSLVPVAGKRGVACVCWSHAFAVVGLSTSLAF